MTVLHRLASVLRWLLRRKKAEQQLDAELQALIDISASEKVRSGVPPAEARRLAALELGGIEQAKERIRVGRHGGLLDEVGRDLRYACRMLAKRPGFTLVVVLTLSLGIGANTAIFSLIDALMLRWLPVSDPQELVLVQMQGANAGRPGETFSYPIARALADQTQVFAAVGGFSGMPFNVGRADSSSRVGGAMVTGGFYETLGLHAVVGRLLTKEDDEPGVPLVAVISYGYWTRQFAQNPAAVGRSLGVNGVPVTIVGVSPRGFVGANVGQIADITLPVAAISRVSPESAPLLGPGNFWLRVLARPKPGVLIPEATTHLATVWPQMADQVIAPHWPASRRKEMADSRFLLVPGGTGWTFMRELYRKPLGVLMGLVALVLLIACTNVASLLLARASARQREIAVRLAIGAGRGRIIRQLLIESMLLAFIGAALGIAMAWLLGRILINTISTGPFPVAFDLTPNLHILSFTTAVAIVTGFLFGLAPALQMTATGPSPALKDDSRMSGLRSWLLPSLVSVQVALSLVLIIAAGLFVRTLKNLQDFDPGFKRQGVLLVDLEGRRTAVPKELLEEVQRVPGVVSTSVSTHTPLSGAIWSDRVVPKGQPVPERDTAVFVGAGPGFFATMQIPLLAGREFTERDSAGSPDVAVINEAFRQQYFPKQNPIGQYLSAVVRSRRTDLEIVGLAGNTNATGLRASPPRAVYVSYAQVTGDFPTTLEIRAEGSLAQVSSAVRKVLQTNLPGATVEVRALSAQVEATIVQERMLATLGSAFGILTLILACVGLYGLLAYNVVRKTKEIGIRTALGARRSHVIAIVLKGALRLVFIGIAVGLPLAWAVSRRVESLLFGLKRDDPTAIVGAIFLLIIAALIAVYLPAQRAARVDPMVALRHE